jgi:hypothetical protein
MSFDVAGFLADCEAAVSADPSHKGVREVVARAVRQPGPVLAALGAPQRAGITVLFNSPTLTVINLVWGPGMTMCSGADCRKTLPARSRRRARGRCASAIVAHSA